MIHAYEVRPRKDHRGVDLISDVLAELTSNSKSFYNCPDLHGGVPGLPGYKNLYEARSR
jgi:hypothetical protein